MENNQQIKPQENKTKYATKNYESLFGIILILLGVSYILDDKTFFNLIWQIVIIVWGALNIKEKNYLYGAILIGFGSLFILDNVFDFNIRDILIGLLFCFIGAKLVFNNLK